MLDMLQALLLFGFIFAVIWFTVINAPPPPVKRSLGPVGLYCSVCREFAGAVDHDEYSRRLQAGTQAYCTRCFLTIEEYERRQDQARRS